MGLIGQDLFGDQHWQDLRRQDTGLWLQFVSLRVFQPFLAIFAGKSNNFGLYLYNLNDINRGWNQNS